MAVSLLKLNSLRSRLMLLVALAITPTVFMTILNGWQERERAVELSKDNLQRLTRMAAVNEAQMLEGARQILRDLSSVPALLGDPEECNELLAKILKNNENYANFGLIQLNGDVTCSAVPSERPVNLGDRSHFKRAISERRFIAGNYVFGRVIQKHTINLTYPVIDENNQVVAVVFAAMDLSELDKFVNDIDLPPDSILITADAEGTIISRRPHPQQWFGKTISTEMLDNMKRAPDQPVILEGPDGVKRLHTFARVGSPSISDYTITIGIPSENIVAAARRDQIMAMIALAATIFLALLATWFVGDFLIVRRVRRLVHTADRIASGSLGTRTGIKYGNEEISHLAQALDKMASALQAKEAEHHRAEEELRAADRRKDEFLAMLAHELRNPLAPISAGADLLRLGHTDAALVEQTSNIISRQTEHMTRLIDDLLDVSRVTRGLVTLAKTPLDMRAIVADAVEQVSPLMQARKHRLELRLPEECAGVEGDHKRLVQVLANLLNNSAKYTPEGGKITLSLHASPYELVLTVDDNGIGMTPELVARVFEPFAQAERTSDRSQGGLGLGLALVKSLIELHGGTVQAASAGLGKGSRMTVRLPRLSSGLVQESIKDADGTSGSASCRIRILIVDDNADALQTLSLFLKAAGHKVVTASRAMPAIELARSFAPQVCLLDIGLPDLDGNELARRLRSMPETANAMIVAVTGYGQEQDKEKSMAAGFDHYLIKPLDTARLSVLLADACRHDALSNP